MGQILSLILRFLFAWIDGIIAKLITQVYNLLMDLSNLMLSGDNIIKGIGQRLGLILGIFMLFRLAITLVDYLISPDKLKDSSKGGTKFITNIIISIVLLGTVNVIFKEAFKIQKTIIDSKIIENVFFGTSGGQNVDIGYYIYSSLFTPNEEALGSTGCEQLWDVTYQYSGSGCDLILHDKLDLSSVNSIAKTKNSLNFSNIFFDYSLVTAHSGSITSGEFYFEYTPILSTAVGVIALLILISFSMDLAIRAIKLLFLQIIAPVPIISNMDPGKGKETFQKWYKECFKTYITVFIRLIVINFAVFMLSLIRGNYKDIFNNNLLLNVFLVIGCLIFAKQVPKLIEDMFGIKMDGMVLHPLKRFQDQALFGKNITSLGAAGLAGAATIGANTIRRTPDIVKNGWGTLEAIGGIVDPRFTGGSRWSNAKRALGSAKDTLYGVGSIAAGGISATSRGTVGAIKGEKFGQDYSKAYKGAITARNNRDARRKLDISAADTMLNNFSRKLGMDTTAEVQDDEIKIAGEFSKSSENNASISEAEIDKNASKLMINRFVNANTGLRETGSVTVNGRTYTYNSLAEMREAAHDQNLTPEARAAIDSEFQRLRGDMAAKLRERSFAGTVGAAGSEFHGISTFDNSAIETMKANIKDMLDIYEKNSTKQVFSATNKHDIAVGKKVHKSVNEIANKIQKNPAFRKAHKIQEQANKEKK